MQHASSRTSHTLCSPALHWTDGHILGNGDLGAVVWGTPNHFCVGLSKHDVNDLRCHGERGATLRQTYPTIRDQVMAGDRNIRPKFESVDSAPANAQQQIACGCLRMELMRTVQPHVFEQTLRFDDAQVIAAIEPTVASWTWGQRVHSVVARLRVLRDRNVALVELESAAPQEISWSFDHAPGEREAAVGYRVTDELTACSTWRLDECSPFAVAIASNRPDCTADRFGIRGRLKFGGELGVGRLIVSVCANEDAMEEAAIALAKEVIDGVDAFIASHEAWWKSFWERSSVQTDVDWLDRTWRLAQFALGASTRPDTSPPNLQGIWCQDEVSPWHADFHFNTNLQACHWLACSSNRPELQGALVRSLAVDWRESFRHIARSIYGSAGLAVPIASDIRGRALSAWGYAEVGMTAWIAQHAWEQFTFTQDRTLLRTVVYPFLRECAQLYCDILVRDDRGQYNVELTHSPEQNCTDAGGREIALYGRNAAIDISVIGALMGWVAEASQILGENVNDALLRHCEQIRANLPPLPTAEGVLIDYETAYFRDGDGPGQLKISHRHPSRLMAIFPQRQVDLGSDASHLALGRRSFDEFHRAYGNSGFTGWSYAYQACIAARLGLAQDALDCLSAVVDHFTLKGGLTSHNSLTPGFANDAELGGPLFQIEALLACGAAINEMLLQRTSDGVIRVFPAWPAGHAGRFEDLRVAGAVRVSASRDGSRVAYVKVVADCDGPLSLFNPWPNSVIARTSDRSAVETHGGLVIHWNAQAGAHYRFESI